MNTGYFRKDKIYKDVGGVTVQIFDFASQPNITANQLATATGMPLARATELIAERTLFDSTQCYLSSVSNINFASASYSVVEPNSGVSIVDVILKRTNGCDGSITITINRIGGTATAGTDYINVFPQTVTWLDSDCIDKTIQVSIIGDTINEPGVAKTLVLGISNPIGNGIIGSLNQTTISITDNDLVYIINTQISSTSNCLPTGSVTYPISTNVLGGSNYNVPINLNGCNLTAILVNGVNVSTLELNNARATGIHPLLNVQSNTTVDLVYQSLVVPCTVLITSNNPLPTATKGVFYSTQLTYSGGVNPVSWSIISGSFPTGLSLSSFGLLSGTNNDGVFNGLKAIVRVTDVNGCTNDKSLGLDIITPFTPNLYISTSARVSDNQTISFAHKGGSFTANLGQSNVGTIFTRDLTLYNLLIADVNVTNNYNVTLEGNGSYTRLYLTAKVQSDITYNIIVLNSTYNLYVRNEIFDTLGIGIYQSSPFGNNNTLVNVGIISPPNVWYAW